MALTKAHNRMVAQAAANVIDYGADATGATDCTAAVQAALDAGSDGVYFPDGIYRMGAVTVDNPVRITASVGAKVVPNLGLAGGYLFNLLSDDVIVDGLTVDGTGQTFTPATGNTQIFFSGDGVTKYSRHTYQNITIKNCSFSDGNSGGTNLLVTHGFYVDNVDDVRIQKNVIDNISGAACFMRDCENFVIDQNTFEDTRWYTIHIVEGCFGWSVTNNRLISGTAEGVYWGGAINTVSDAGEVKQRDGYIANNTITGTYSYGAVIRLQSSDNVIVEHNMLKDLSIGTLGSDLSGIRVTTRGISSASKNEPPQNNIIRFNTLYGPASGAKRLGIYTNNDFWTTRNPVRKIAVYGNKLISVDTSNYWGEGIVFHGLSGGIEDVTVFDNEIEIYSQSGATVAGAIGFLANNAGGKIDRAHIGGNRCVDIGTPASSYQIGISIGAYSDNVRSVYKNYVDNFFYGVRTFTSSGPTIDFVDDQDWGTNSNNTLFAVEPRYGVLGSAWNGSMLVMGSYYLWVDATGDLRIKNGAPTSDTDGTIVGTQS